MAVELPRLELPHASTLMSANADPTPSPLAPAVRLLGDEVNHGMATLGLNTLDELGPDFLAPLDGEHRTA